MCMVLLFMNQCRKLPSGGIIVGYFFVCCLACSSADNWGPGYLGGSFRIRDPWEGGLNLVGFSRTNGLELLEPFFTLFEAWRMIVPEVVGVGDRDNRVRHIVPLWGRRNRGIADMLSILFYSWEALFESTQKPYENFLRWPQDSLDADYTVTGIAGITRRGAEEWMRYDLLK